MSIQTTQHSKHRFVVLSLALAANCAFAARAGAQTPCELVFPLEQTAADPATGSLSLAVRPGELMLLREQERVVLTRTPLPAGTFPEGTLVDLELERIAIDHTGLELRIDGVRAEPAQDAAQSVWRGRVAGESGSDVFLAFSTYGSRGWIRYRGEYVHLLAGPGPDGDWTRSRSMLVSETSLNALGSSLGNFCSQERVLPSRPAPAPTPVQGGGTFAAVTGPTLVCKMAIETDYPLYTDFNSNTIAEQVYITALFAAANSRYLEQINTVLQMVYLGLHTNANDGWSSGNQGFGSGDQLDEFREAWAGNFPGGANLAHFLSGAGLGGGVAYLDVLCNQNYGFAVSGNITKQGGLTPFPVMQGPLTWDFVVFTHETGHNFGTTHTHNFCPPLDSCPSTQYFGQCQTAQVCSNTGTLMSYCHLCSGGMNNITTYFHPQCVTVMREDAEDSCIGNFCGGPSTYCVAAPNSTGVGALIAASGSTSVAANSLVLTTTQLPPLTSNLFYYGPAQQQVAFGNGFQCISGGIFRLGAQNANASGVSTKALNLLLPPASSGAGAITAGSTWKFQNWYRNPGAGGALFNLSNAVSVPFCP